MGNIRSSQWNSRDIWKFLSPQPLWKQWHPAYRCSCLHISAHCSHKARPGISHVLGFVTGLVYRKFQPKKWQIFPAAVAITLPSTLISSCITAFLFGGITSSGSSILVQLLSKTPLGMVGSCFVVQFVTDYIDRVLCLALAAVMIGALRKNMKESFIR